MGLRVLYYVEYSLYNVKKVGFFYLGWNYTKWPNASPQSMVKRGLNAYPQSMVKGGSMHLHNPRLKGA